ncbi:MAG: hypothetical protein C3F11_18590 [Methylocystaceae bacterium]|nr:MAG: hypothetical protein C3F11_18590 [Methylocystaceae bacterium]
MSHPIEYCDRLRVREWWRLAERGLQRPSTGTSLFFCFRGLRLERRLLNIRLRQQKTTSGAARERDGRRRE